MIKLAIPTEYIENLSVHDLLETIQANLTINIDSIYNEVIGLIDTEKERRLGWKKEELKKQIAEYLKTVVKNITHQLLYYDVNIVLVKKIVI